MKSLKIFIVVVCVFGGASVARAECLTCQRIGPLTNPATCRTAEGPFCSGICCYSDFGTPCTQPDEVFPCPYGSSSSIMRVSRESAPSHYFTVGRMREVQSVRLWERIGTAVSPAHRSRCGGSPDRV